RRLVVPRIDDIGQTLDIADRQLRFQMDGGPRPPRQHQVRLHIRTLLEATKQLDPQHRARRSGHAHDDPSHPRITPTTRYSVTVRTRIAFRRHGFVRAVLLLTWVLGHSIGSLAEPAQLSMFSPTTPRPVSTSISIRMGRSIISPMFLLLSGFLKAARRCAILAR